MKRNTSTATVEIGSAVPTVAQLDPARLPSPATAADLEAAGLGARTHYPSAYDTVRTAAREARPSNRPGMLLDSVAKFADTVGAPFDLVLAERENICRLAGTLATKSKATATGARGSWTLNLVHATKSAAAKLDPDTAAATVRQLQIALKMLAIFAPTWSGTAATE